jgi:hypothetical protein
MVQQSWLLWYAIAPMALIEDVTIVCHTEALEQISAYTSSLPLNITVKVIAPSSVEDNLGSAEVLNLLKDTVTVFL